MNSNLSFALGRTIPIKFQLSDFNGTLITSLNAVISLQVQLVDGNGNPLAAPFNPTPAGGTNLRNDGSQYVFNWETKGLTAGTYAILLTLNDATVHTQVLTLNSKSGTAGLLAAGVDELARVQDAVNTSDFPVNSWSRDLATASKLPERDSN